MKKILISSIILLVLFPLMSCIDEPAQPVTTQGIIKEISHDWTCNMDEEGTPVDFTAIISANPANNSEILISNFHKMGTDQSVSVIVNEDLTLEIPEQIKNNQVFKGTGMISDDYTEITWNYTIEDENETIIHVTGKYSYGISS